MTATFIFLKILKTMFSLFEVIKHFSKAWDSLSFLPWKSSVVRVGILEQRFLKSLVLHFRKESRERGSVLYKLPKDSSKVSTFFVTPQGREAILGCIHSGKKSCSQVWWCKHFIPAGQGQRPGGFYCEHQGNVAFIGSPRAPRTT